MDIYRVGHTLDMMDGLTHIRNLATFLRADNCIFGLEGEAYGGLLVEMYGAFVVAACKTLVLEDELEHQAGYRWLEPIPPLKSQQLRRESPNLHWALGGVVALMLMFQSSSIVDGPS